MKKNSPVEVGIVIFLIDISNFLKRLPVDLGDGI